MVQTIQNKTITPEQSINKREETEADFNRQNNAAYRVSVIVNKITGEKTSAEVWNGSKAVGGSNNQEGIFNQAKEMDRKTGGKLSSRRLANKVLREKYPKVWKAHKRREAQIAARAKKKEAEKSRKASVKVMKKTESQPKISASVLFAPNSPASRWVDSVKSKYPKTFAIAEKITGKVQEHKEAPQIKIPPMAGHFGKVQDMHKDQMAEQAAAMEAELAELRNAELPETNQTPQSEETNSIDEIGNLDETNGDVQYVKYKNFEICEISERKIDNNWASVTYVVGRDPKRGYVLFKAYQDRLGNTQLSESFTSTNQRSGSVFIKGPKFVSGKHDGRIEFGTWMTKDFLEETLQESSDGSLTRREIRSYKELLEYFPAIENAENSRTEKTIQEETE